MNVQMSFRRVLTGLALLGCVSITAPAIAQSELAQGEVRRLDVANAKVTIRHGEIKRLDMPPMTMVFVAQPPSILKGIQVGDRIRFDAIEKNSQYIVTKIEKVDP